MKCTETAPIFYDQSQIDSISPQLDELISQCEQLLGEAQVTLQDADVSIEQASAASQSLNKPIELQKRIRQAEQQFRELKVKAGIQVSTAKNLSFGHCTIQGRRATNEDAHCVFQAAKEERVFSVAAVFDGHAGEKAAEFCGEHFEAVLLENEMFPASVSSAIKTSFQTLDRQFLQVCKTSGCTAVAAIYDPASAILTAGNAGDARCICGTLRRVIECTHDHKPSQPAEKARIEAAGSFVTTMFGVPRVNGMLAVSRAIGDEEYKQFGVISEPEVYEYEVPDLLYVVVACDGLFDVLNNDEVDLIVRSCFGLDKPENSEKSAGNSNKIMGGCEDSELLQKAAKLYMSGDVTEADKLMLDKAGMTFVNFKVAVEPTATMTKEDKCACILTRIAFLLGSTDNITAMVGIVDEV